MKNTYKGLIRPLKYKANTSKGLDAEEKELLENAKTEIRKL